MSIKRYVMFIFLLLGIFTFYGCSDRVVSKASLSQLKECYGDTRFSSETELENRGDNGDCDKLTKNFAEMSQRNLEAYYFPFLYFLLLVISGGVVGGAMNSIAGPNSSSAQKSSKDEQEAPKDEQEGPKDAQESSKGEQGSLKIEQESSKGEQESSKDEKNADLGIYKTIFIGVGASIVGVTFLGSFVHLKYEKIAPLEPGSVVSVPDFIETSITIMGLAIISGFLGVRLVKKVADGLLNEKLDKLERNSSDNRKEIIDSFNERVKALDNMANERAIAMENMANFRDLIHNGWYSILKGCDLIGPDKGKKLEGDRYIREGVETLEDAILLNDEHAKTFTWLAFGYKRLEQTTEALVSIQRAIDLDPSATRYYNKACYLSLLQRPIDEVLDSLRMVDKLVDVKDAISFDTISDGIKDTDTDFEAIRDNVEFSDFLRSSKFR